MSQRRRTKNQRRAKRQASRARRRAERDPGPARRRSPNWDMTVSRSIVFIVGTDEEQEQMDSFVTSGAIETVDDLWCPDCRSKMTAFCEDTAVVVQCSHEGCPSTNMENGTRGSIGAPWMTWFIRTEDGSSWQATTESTGWRVEQQ